MHKLSIAILALFILTFKAPAQTEQIVWEKDYKKALALARETGKPLMLDFAADWCVPCRKMDAEFWVLPEVVEAVKPFIAVKLDFDEETSLASKYKVSSIPNVVFTDPLGNMITSRRGFSKQRVSELNRIFDEMPKDFSPLKKLYDALDVNKNDGVVLVTIADSYYNSKLLYLSSEFYKRALKTPEIKTDEAYSERITFTLGVTYFALQDYEQAVEYLEDYLKVYPTGRNREVSLSVLTIANVRRKKLKNAKKYLEILKAEFPESKNVQIASKAVENAESGKDK